MMVVRRMLVIGAVLVLGVGNAALAQTIISVDMDTATDGIQDVRSVMPGDTFQAGLWMQVDTPGISSYGVTAEYDPLELNLFGDPPGAEVLPDGFDFALEAGVNRIDQVVGGLGGSIGMFDAASLFGGAQDGALFQFGTIEFLVKEPVLDDGLADVIVGTNGPLDDLFDLAGRPAVVEYRPGFVIPEPASMLLLGMGGLALMRRRR